MKPSIRKQDGRWLLTRPGYGFSQDTVDEFDSHKEALESLRTAPGSAGPVLERGSFTLGLYGRWGLSRRGTIRMEDT